MIVYMGIRERLKCAPRLIARSIRSEWEKILFGVKGKTLTKRIRNFDCKVPLFGGVERLKYLPLEKILPKGRESIFPHKTRAKLKVKRNGGIMVNRQETKKAAPDVSGIGNGSGIISQAIESNTQANYKGNGQRRQVPKVSDYLERGAEKATSTQELQQLVGCATVRQLRQMVEDERRNGVLILSSTAGGYYLPDTGQKGRAEIQRYLATMCARATAIIQATEAARKALYILDGQIDMEDGQ